MVLKPRTSEVSVASSLFEDLQAGRGEMLREILLTVATRGAGKHFQTTEAYLFVGSGQVFPFEMAHVGASAWEQRPAACLRPRSAYAVLAVRHTDPPLAPHPNMTCGWASTIT